MKTEQKRTFVVELDGKPVKLAIVLPTPADEQEGREVYSKAWRQAALPADGCPAFHREDLDWVARQRGLWDDARQARDEQLLERLRTGAKALATSGIRVSAAKVIAVGMYADRQELRALREGLARLNATTVEGRAEQSRFNHLVAACTVWEDTGERYFQSAEEMLGRDADPVVYAAGREFAALVHGIDPEADLKNPESVFLLKHNFATVEDGQLRIHDQPARIAG